MHIWDGETQVSVAGGLKVSDQLLKFGTHTFDSSTEGKKA